MNDTTPSILCKHGGAAHTHHSVIESKVCYGLLPPSALATVSVSASGPSVLHSPPVPEPRVTSRQLDYIESLGGPGARQAAKHLDRKSASALIDELKKKPKEATVTQPPRPAREPDPRHAMISGLLPMVPDGYYAVHQYEGGHVDFMRVSRPKKNKYAGGIKIQTVMGSWQNVRLKSEPDAILWPSGSFSVYDRSGSTEDKLLLLVADYNGARRRYAQLLGTCCRCNATLTDDKSRHYGIGPECVKHWPEIVEQVDMEDAIARAEADL